MSTKMFCDRCGDEHNNTPSAKVVKCVFTVNNTAEHMLDLCGSCVSYIKNAFKPPPQQMKAQPAERVGDGCQ